MGVLLVRVQWPPYHKERDRMSVTDTQVMKVERGRKGVLGYGGMSLPVDSSHKAACRPYHLRACTVIEQHD